MGLLDGESSASTKDEDRTKFFEGPLRALDQGRDDGNNETIDLQNSRGMGRAEWKSCLKRGERRMKRDFHELGGRSMWHYYDETEEEWYPEKERHQDPRFISTMIKRD